MIYTRIDTYSVVFYNCNISSVLKTLDIPCDDLYKLFDNNYKAVEVGVGDKFVFSNKNTGLRFEAKFYEYIDFIRAEEEGRADIDIIDFPFSYLRFYISGTGVDYIENLEHSEENYTLQVKFSDPNVWSECCETWVVTRCDFAFDYVNYEGNEFERLRKIIADADFNDKYAENGRLHTSQAGGISFSYRGGKERTIYLGSSNAQRMLRIYDKKFQLCKDGIWDDISIPKAIKENEITIESWYRVELQCRRDFAERYLISCQGDFRYIMGEICNYFDARDKDGKKIAPLHKIFLWTQRTPIIQKANCSKPLSEIESAESWVGSIALRNVFLMLGTYGVDGFVSWVNRQIAVIAQSPVEKRLAWLNSVNNQIHNIAMQEGLQIDSFGNVGDFIKGDDGFYYIRPRPTEYQIKTKGPYSEGGSSQ